MSGQLGKNYAQIVTLHFLERPLQGDLQCIAIVRMVGQRLLKCSPDSSKHLMLLRHLFLARDTMGCGALPLQEHLGLSGREDRALCLYSARWPRYIPKQLKPDSQTLSLQTQQLRSLLVAGSPKV